VKSIRNFRAGAGGEGIGRRRGFGGRGGL